MRETIRTWLITLTIVIPCASALAVVRLTNDSSVLSGYVSTYTLATGKPYTDATLAECSRSRGRQNEPSVAVNPRNTNVIIGSSNDYCGVYNDGVDADVLKIRQGRLFDYAFARDHQDKAAFREFPDGHDASEFPIRRNLDQIHDRFAAR